MSGINNPHFNPSHHAPWFWNWEITLFHSLISRDYILGITHTVASGRFSHRASGMRVKEGKQGYSNTIKMSKTATGNYIKMNEYYCLCIKTWKSLFAFNSLMPDKCLRLTQLCISLKRAELDHFFTRFYFN